MNSQRQQLIREELLRSIAWIGLGIFGWPLVISEVAWLDATAVTVFGLPALTWAGLTTSMIAVRVATGTEFQVQTPTGFSASLLLGVMLGGVGAVYFATAGGYSALWVSAAYVAVTSLTILWYWFAGSDAVDTPMTT